MSAQLAWAFSCFLWLIGGLALLGTVCLVTMVLFAQYLIRLVGTAWTDLVNITARVAKITKEVE